MKAVRLMHTIAANRAKLPLQGPWLGEKSARDPGRLPALMWRDFGPSVNYEEVFAGEPKAAAVKAAVLAMYYCCRPVDVSRLGTGTVQHIFAAQEDYSMFSSAFTADTRWLILELLSRKMRSENLNFPDQFYDLSPKYIFPAPISIDTATKDGGIIFRPVSIAGNDMRNWMLVIENISGQISRYFTYPGMTPNETPERAKVFMTGFLIRTFSPEALRMLGILK